jgi:hypothetical protein
VPLAIAWAVKKLFPGEYFEQWGNRAGTDMQRTQRIRNPIQCHVAAYSNQVILGGGIAFFEAIQGIFHKEQHHCFRKNERMHTGWVSEFGTCRCIACQFCWRGCFVIKPANLRFGVTSNSRATHADSTAPLFNPGSPGVQNNRDAFAQLQALLLQFAM